MMSTVPPVSLIELLLVLELRSALGSFYYKDSEPEDFLIGVLLPIHQAPYSYNPGFAQGGACGAIWEDPGIHRMEAVLQAVDEINARRDLLPYSRLGIQVRDTCGYAPVALEHAIKYIRLSAWLDADYKDVPYPYSLTQQGSANPTGCSDTDERNNLVAVLGPSASGGSLEVQGLLQLFRIPQVGYSPTVDIMGTGNRSPYYISIELQDDGLTKAMADIAAHFGWTYLSAVYTEDPGNGAYGRSRIQEFTAQASLRSICVATTQALPASAIAQDYDRVVKALLDKPRAEVVVCFCEAVNVRGILKGLRRNNATGRFTLFGSDRWGMNPSVVKNIEHEAVGSIVIRTHVVDDPGFEQYFTSMKPDSNKRNPWFREFWETRFGCSFPDTNGWRYSRTCTGEEDLGIGYQQDPKLDQIKKGVYLVAHALHNMLAIHCDNETDLACMTKMHVNSSQFMAYLENATFYWGNGTERLKATASFPTTYDIYNYRFTGKKTYDFVRIGEWTDGHLDIVRPPVWGPKSRPHAPKSICSLPCKSGQVKVPESSANIKCCWKCVRCGDNQYTLNVYICNDCPQGYWPNSSKTGCDPIQPEFLQWTDTASIVSITLNLAIIAFTLLVIVVFIINIHTPIVKASSRELSFVTLFGILLSNLSTFVILAEPTAASCGAERILPPVALTIIHAAILTKTHRISRILAVRETATLVVKRRFMSTASLLITTGLFTLVQIVISVTMMIIEPPGTRQEYPEESRVLLICDTSEVARFSSLGLDFVIILLCTVYAVKTRNVPASFNEAKMIGFAMYSTLVIWVSYVAIRQGSVENRDLSLCVALSLSGAVVLALLFAPKVYVMLFRPHKNERSAFFTFRNNVGLVSTVSHGSLVLSRSSTDTNLMQYSSKNIDDPYTPGQCRKLRLYSFRDIE